MFHRSFIPIFVFYVSIEAVSMKLYLVKAGQTVHQKQKHGKIRRYDMQEDTLLILHVV